MEQGLGVAVEEERRKWGRKGEKIREGGRKGKSTFLQ